MKKIEKGKTVEIKRNEEGEFTLKLPPKSVLDYDHNEINAKIAEVWNPDTVFKNPGVGRAFGDCLAWASFIARLSQAYDGEPIRVRRPRPLFKKCWDEILDVKNARYEIDNKSEYHQMHSWAGGVYKWPFLPAKVTYDKKNVDNKLIAYQFQTRTHKDKQLREGEEEIIINDLRDMGYNPQPIGKMNDEAENFRLASSCNHFIGICSGMSHFCHAVGTPVRLIRNERSESRMKRHHQHYGVEYYEWYFDYLEVVKRET